MINISLIIFLTIHVIHCMDNGCSGEPGEFKYLVSVRRFGEMLCSGVIIHESYILTVGHLVRNVHSTALGIIADFVMGTHPRFTYFSVEYVSFHPGFRRMSISDDNEYWANDIALLRNLSWTPNVGPIQLANSNLPGIASALFACRIVSWNPSMGNYESSMAPMWDFANILWDRNCYPWNMVLLMNEKCFIDPLRTGIMSSAFMYSIDILIEKFSQRDLGSPIICENMMVGLTVRTHGDGTAGWPSIFLSLLPYRDFITGIIDDDQFDVNTGEFPYVASIWFNNNHHCGGIILDANHILSAGHCLDRTRLPGYQVTFGFTTVWRFGPLIPWLSINDFDRDPSYRHQENLGWLATRKKHDIAVISLRGNALWSPTVGPTDWPELVAFPPGHVCVVLHWEKAENEFGVSSIKLKKFPVVILDRPPCQQLGVRLRVNEFCGKPISSSSVIKPEDSGNPIICGGKPFGIVVQALAPPMPTIFLKLFPYREFITASMGSGK